MPAVEEKVEVEKEGEDQEEGFEVEREQVRSSEEVGGHCG